jgi:hypothetical protein
MTTRRVRSLVVGLAVGAFVVGGCGSAAPATIAPVASSPSVAAPSAVAPSVVAPSVAAPSVTASGPAASVPSAGASLPTTGRIAVPAKGYAITLPAAWTRVDLDAGALSDILKAGASGMPAGMQDMLAGQVGQMAASGVSLFAFRQPSGAIAPGTTLNVLSLPAMGIPLDTFESLIVSQLKGVVGADTEIATSRVQGPAGEFLKLSYVLKSGAVSVGTVQYVFVAPAKQIVISCGSPGGVDAIQAECETIATSLEILP